MKLQELRKESNITQEKLAKKLGVSRSTVAMWETGKSEPDQEILIKICDYFNVSTDYLLGKTEIRAAQKEELLPFDNLFRIKKRAFPLLGEIACGEPLFANEDRESYVMASTDIKADFCLKAKGDSMMNARILDGDIVFIRQQPMVNNGEIAAVIIDNEATLKRVFYYPEQNKLVLNPENSKYEPLVYVGEELNDIRIIGKAIAFQSDVI